MAVLLSEMVKSERTRQALSAVCADVWGCSPAAQSEGFVLTQHPLYLYGIDIRVE